VRLEGLSPVGIEDDVDLRPLDADNGRAAERHAARSEALPTLLGHLEDCHGSIDRFAGGGARLAAEAQLDRRALAGGVTEGYRDRIPDRRDADAIDPSLEHGAQ